MGLRTSLDGFGGEKKISCTCWDSNFGPPSPSLYRLRCLDSIYVFSFDIKMFIVLDGVPNFKPNVLFLKMSFRPPRLSNVNFACTLVRFTSRLGQVCMNLTLLSGQ